MPWYMIKLCFCVLFLCWIINQSQNLSPRPTTAVASNNTTNTTGSFNYNMTGNNGNNVYNSNPTGNNPISNQMPTTLPTMLSGNSPTMTGTGNLPSMNGQSHIFASTSLLFGSFALQALWQWAPPWGSDLDWVFNDNTVKHRFASLSLLTLLFAVEEIHSKLFVLDRTVV